MFIGSVDFTWLSKEYNMLIIASKSARFERVKHLSIQSASSFLNSRREATVSVGCWKILVFIM